MRGEPESFGRGGRGGRAIKPATLTDLNESQVPRTMDTPSEDGKGNRHVVSVASKEGTPLCSVIVNVVNAEARCIAQQYIARKTDAGKLVLHELSGMQRVFGKASVIQHKDKPHQVIFAFKPLACGKLEKSYYIRVISGGSCVDTKLDAARVFPGLD